MGASGSFLLLSLPLSAERLSERGAELWRGRSCSSAFAVELCGADADPQVEPRDATCFLFLPLFSEASLSRHASQVGLRVVPLLPLISLGLGPGWRPGHADFCVD